MHRHSPTRALVRIFACLALAVTFVPVAATPSFGAPSLVISGSGWGHGVGLSQWGAWGFAKHGTLPNGTAATGPNIAAWYYPGSKASVLATSTDKTMLVQLDKGANGTNLGFTHTSWSLKPGWVGTTMTLVFGTKKVVLTWANSPYSFAGSGSSLVVKDKNGHAVSGSPFAGTVDVYPASPGGSDPPLITVVNPSALYGNPYIRYRGAMRLASSGGKARLVNKLNMQQYLYGVVPRESMSSWYFESASGTWVSGGKRYNIAALEAQAIVSRGYAWASTRAPLYCDTRDQAYEGHSRVNSDGSLHAMYEATSSNAAVNNTLRRFVTNAACPNANHVVSTNFYDSSGGHTCNVEDVWLGSTAYSFYRGVADPYSFDAQTDDPWNPITMSSLTAASKIAAKITGEPSGAGTSVYVKGLSCDRASSGYVRRVDVVWSNGAVTKSVAGDTIRSALGLRSTKFYLGGPYTRIAVGDRYSTAAAISKSSFPTAGSASCAVIVNGADTKFADALTASALGGTASGPVLLSYATALPTASKAELGRLKPKKAYIVGGTGSVSSAVVTQIKSSDPGVSVVRLDGATRYEVAAKVAAEISKLKPGGGPVYLASGETWPDAAIAAATAATAKRPLLLLSHTGMPSATGNALKSLGATQSAIFGGGTLVPSAVVKQVCAVTGESSPYARFGATGDRYAEAAAAASWSVSHLGTTVSTVYVSSGSAFADTVCGGALAAHNRHPLLLTAAASAPSSTLQWLTANKDTITSLVVLGGTRSVSNSCAGQMGGAAY